MTRKLVTFLSDDDGFSARDFLMISFSLLFIVFLIVAFYQSLTGEVNPQTLQLIQSMDGVMITIVGGVFGIQGVREFNSRKEAQEHEQYNKHV